MGLLFSRRRLRQIILVFILILIILLFYYIYTYNESTKFCETLKVHLTPESLIWRPALGGPSSPKPFHKTCLYDNSSSGISDGVEGFFYRPAKVDLVEFYERQGYQNGHVIPKILHRTWKNETVPDKWISGQISCSRANLEYLYCHWTDEDLWRFMATYYPWFLVVFDSYPHPIQRVDAARYFLLYHFGGIYIDLDIMCKESFSSVFNRINSTYDVLLAEGKPTGLVGDFFATKPRQNFFHYVISNLCISSKINYLLPDITVLSTTGPWFLSYIHRQYMKIGVSSLNQNVSRIYVMSKQLYEKVFGFLRGGSWQKFDAWVLWNLYLSFTIKNVVCALVLIVILVLSLYWIKRRFKR